VDLSPVLLLREASGLAEAAACTTPAAKLRRQPRLTLAPERKPEPQDAPQWSDGDEWCEERRRRFHQEHDCERPELLHVLSELLKWNGLNDWERGFVNSLREQYPKLLTEKQNAKLQDITRKYNYAHRD
jgi:hypothetical protein